MSWILFVQRSFRHCFDRSVSLMVFDVSVYMVTVIELDWLMVVLFRQRCLMRFPVACMFVLFSVPFYATFIVVLEQMCWSRQFIFFFFFLVSLSTQFVTATCSWRKLCDTTGGTMPRLCFYQAATAPSKRSRETSSRNYNKAFLVEGCKHRAHFTFMDMKLSVILNCASL